MKSGVNVDRRTAPRPSADLGFGLWVGGSRRFRVACKARRAKLTFRCRRFRILLGLGPRMWKLYLQGGKQLLFRKTPCL